MGITLISVGVSGARRWLIRRWRRPWWFACTLFAYHWTTQVGIPLETVHMDRTIVIDKTSTNSLQKHLTQTHNAPTSQFSFFAPPITSLHDMSNKIELETKGCPIYCIQWIARAEKLVLKLSLGYLMGVNSEKDPFIGTSPLKLLNERSLHHT